MTANGRRRHLIATGGALIILLLSIQCFVRDVSSLRFIAYRSSGPLSRSSAFLSTSINSRRQRTDYFRPTNIANSVSSSNNRIFSKKLYSSQSSEVTTTTTSTAATTYSPDDVVELQYSEFLPPLGESSHPPVIFLHGLLGNKRNFASLASSLSTQLRNPRPIYTLDLRNHGENTHDWRSSMSYSEMARDVLAFMDRIAEMNTNNGGSSSSSHEKAILVGHSMGGKVAQSLALMHPDRIAGLVVLDIAPVRYYSDQPDNKGSNSNKGDGSGWKAVEEIVRSVASIDLSKGGYTTKRDVDMVLRQGMLEDPALRAFVLTNLEQLRKTDENEVPLRWKIHWDGIVNQLHSIAGFDVHDQVVDDSIIGTSLEEIQSTMQYEGDVFFIHGGASRFVRHSYISTIATYFPNHMLTTIRGVGHWVHAEAPDDTIALLKRYLDR